MKSNRLAAVVALCFLVACSGCKPADKKAGILARAETYFANCEYEKAALEYMNVLQIDPTHAHATEQLGASWLERGAPIPAIRYLAKAKSLAPHNLEARVKLAAALLALGKVDDARKEAAEIVEKSAAQTGALVILTETARSKADFDLAMKALANASQTTTPEFNRARTNLLVAKGDFESARRLLRSSMEASPKNAALRLASGALYVRQGESEAAENEYRTAAELSPAVSAEKLRYAEFLVQTGKVEMGESYLRQLSARSQHWLVPKRLLAQVAISKGKYADAEPLLAQILAMDPSNVEAGILQTSILLERGKTQEAVERLTGLHTSNPGLPIINYYLARALIRNNNAGEATKVLRIALATEPDRVDCAILLAELDLRGGRASSCVAGMTGLLKKYPHLVQAQLLLINGLRALGRRSEAIGVVKEQVRVYPKNPQPRVLLGILLREQGQIDAARQSLAAALEISPGYAPAINELINSDLADQDFEAALNRAQELQKRDPASPDATFATARVLSARRDWSGAETALEETLRRSPAHPGAYDLLLAVYVTSGRMEEAIRRLQLTLEKQPHDENALMLSGLIQSKMGDFVRARQMYEQLLAVKPDAVPALNNLAYLYTESFGEHDKAYALAQKARELAPGSPPVADTLGWILYKRREYEPALALLNEAAQMLPTAGEIHYHVGMVNLALGKADAAEHAFRTALTEGGDFPARRDAERKLQTLK